MLYLQAFLDCGLGKTLPLAALDIDIQPPFANDKWRAQGAKLAYRTTLRDRHQMAY